jgi:hypothetical protein
VETQPPNFIDYGSRARRPRWIILSILACVFATAGAVYTRRVALLRWWGLVQLRHQVLTYELPPGTVLFHQKTSDTAQSVLQSVTQVPSGMTAKDRMEGRLYPIQTVNTGDPWTVLLHERWTRSGKHRVVLVTANVVAFPQDVHLALAVRLFDAGSVLHPAFTVLTLHAASGVKIRGEIPGYAGVLPSVARVPYGSDFELLAGRPDPADRSAFLFDLCQGDKTITIRGSIADDDSLSLLRSDGKPLPIRIEPTTRPSD